MEKVIKGTINYELKISDKHTDIEYDSTIDNDLAVLHIFQYLCEAAAVGMRENKSQSTGKEKQIISESIQRVVHGRNAVNTLIAMFLDGYDEIKKIEFLKENNITVEQGTLSKEKVLELFNNKQNVEDKKD